MPTESTQPAGNPASGENIEEIYQTIARKVKEGSCVLFIGPAAMLAKNSTGSWQPLTDLCAQYLLKKYNLSLEPGETASLPFVTSLLRIRNLSTDSVLQDDVAGFYKSQADKAEFHPMLEALTDLRFRIIINTTPDNFITRFYDEIARAYQTDFYNWYKPAPGFNYDFEKNPQVLIYNLFGYYDKPESLVLTYKHQLSYIKKIVSEQQNERLPDALTNAFKDFRYHLFLGFDFEDWSLRLLLDTLYKNVRDNIQPYSYPASGGAETGADIRVFFQGEFSMQFPSVDMVTFVNNLVEQYKNLDNQPIGSSNEQPRAQALILHNASADNDGAELLAKYLRTINLKVVTLADAVGQGDVQAWIRQTLDQSQVVLPLLTVDFFDAAGNPSLPLLDDIIRRNNPRKQFLVMPILLKPVSLDGPIGQLDSLRPLDRQPVLGNGQENKYMAEITDGLKRYVDKLPPRS
jgi:hypothetical protein